MKVKVDGGVDNKQVMLLMKLLQMKKIMLDKNGKECGL
jgi:hypothetical protein